MGTVVISIDAELGWGFYDFPEPPADRLAAARSGWHRLLDVLGTYDVPATWAVVGHLLLEDCDGVHADHPSIEGWFERERTDWRDRPDLRFGPDLVEGIRDAAVDHEIACHTFSHALFDDPRVTREIARAEIAAAIDVAAPHGIDYDSLIFPRNGVGHRNVLGEFGISAYRSKAVEPEGRLRRSADKFASAALPRATLVEPTVDEYGLVDVPPSLYLFGFEGRPRRLFASIWVDPIVRQAKRGIDRASREDGVFHVWLHPNNLVTDRDARRVDAIVEYAAKRRKSTDLTIETMASVAERTLWERAVTGQTP